MELPNLVAFHSQFYPFLRLPLLILLQEGESTLLMANISFNLKTNIFPTFKVVLLSVWHVKKCQPAKYIFTQVFNLYVLTLTVQIHFQRICCHMQVFSINSTIVLSFPTKCTCFSYTWAFSTPLVERGCSFLYPPPLPYFLEDILFCSYRSLLKLKRLFCGERSRRIEHWSSSICQCYDR